ncbi:hypothetical protein SLA2020_512200 [Shorea laevis]
MPHKTHVAMLPSPGVGHLIPLLGLATDLVQSYDFIVTVIIPTIGPPAKALVSLLESLPEGIDTVFLPPVFFEDTMPREAQIFLAIKESLASIRNVFESFVKSEKTVTALITDMFGTDAFDVAMEFKVPSYLYFLISAMCFALFISQPKLHETVSCNLRDLPEPLKLPGCVPIHGRDFPEAVRDRSSEPYKTLLHHAKRCSLAEGVLLNSFMELEPATVEALQKEDSGNPFVYPIGPRLQTGSTNGGADESGCLNWLHQQPLGSVLFVCFGSGGTLSFDQLTELALGLEKSGQKFIWVVRSPDEKSAAGSYLSAESKTDPFGFLPEGYLDRTKEQGLLVPSWAPQMQILAHKSTAGFLTHCGWNSALESIINGVPMIAWPLYAEQSTNAVLLTEALKVALRPKPNQNGLVGREEIAKTVKSLMQGEEGMKIRERMNVMKEAAANAVSEGGSSTKTLSQLVLKWKNRKLN